MTSLLILPGVAELMLVFFLLAILLIPKIFYLISLQSIFDEISFENRKMNSGNVWLLLIPIFGLIWHFIIVNNLADSIRNEVDDLNVNIAEPRPAINIGLAMCILNCLIFIPVLNILTSLAGLICWIIYWSEINSYKRVLIAAKSKTRS